MSANGMDRLHPPSTNVHYGSLADIPRLPSECLLSGAKQTFSTLNLHLYTRTDTCSESVGVLHHLGDPLAGWRVLVDLLRPEGLMRIGLYSETARQDIISGRALIAEEGYTSSPEDIR